MKNKLFTVFTGPSAQGNPAEVLLVDQLPNLQTHLKYIQSKPDYSDHTMVYIKPLAKETFSIRWFNNKKAIKRCGHGTLAATAFVHNQQEHHGAETRYSFVSDSETLNVLANKNHYTLAFPITELNHITVKSSDKSASNKHDNSLFPPLIIYAATLKQKIKRVILL